MPWPLRRYHEPVFWSARPEPLRHHFLNRLRCKSPTKSPWLHLRVVGDLTDPANRQNQDAAWFQKSVQCCNRPSGLKDVLKHLGENDAIELIGRNMVGMRQVGHDGGLRIILLDAPHRDLCDLIPSIASRIGVIEEFQHVPPDIVLMRREELLNVITINTEVPLEFPSF